MTIDRLERALVVLDDWRAYRNVDSGDTVQTGTGRIGKVCRAFVTLREVEVRWTDGEVFAIDRAHLTRV